MSRCYKCCDHYHLGFCIKYNESIIVSRNPAHLGLLIHPLHYLSLYYNYDKKDVSHLIDVANKYLNDNVSKSVCKQYEQKGYVTYKQRKYLIYNILHCCEETPRTYDGDITFVQVE
jgi:hypothetical protein